MEITLGSDLESALMEHAHRQGVAPEVLAVQALRERFLTSDFGVDPKDEWERPLRIAATDCGVSLSNEAVSSVGLYD